MKQTVISVMLAALLLCQGANAQKRVELVKFGDFEEWVTRNIKESGIIGGNTKTIYAIGPTETINVNRAYDYSKTIWGTSNAYAVVSGVTKGSCSVTPDNGPSGKCAKLTTIAEKCKALGIININVVATGSICWGKVIEPVKSTKNPYAIMDWGIPFTGRPAAVIFDYKAEMPCSGTLTKGSSSLSTIAGSDPQEMKLILQNRWEDENGKLHAKRVGTAVLRIFKSTTGWKLNQRVEVIYGDASKKDGFQSYMDLIPKDKSLYSTNKSGERVPVVEEGWATAGTPVTHAILKFSSGSCEAYTGEIGNTLWVDNVRLEYNK